MVRFVICCILVLIAFILLMAKGIIANWYADDCAGYDKDSRSGAIKSAKGCVNIICLIMVLIGGILALTACIKTVKTGNTGIVTVFGEVKDYTYEAGVHFDAPWVKIIEMDNRTQKQTIQMSCFSSDIQEVNVLYTINFQISKQDAQTIYKTIGTSYFDIVVYPKVLESVKAVIAKYNAENLVESRGKLSSEIEEILRQSMGNSNIELVSTSLENLDFTDAFTNAVEAKQVAEQDKLRAKTEQEQAIIVAEAEAEKKRIAAQAEADARLIAAQNDVEVQRLAADASEYAGQKQASINERIASSLTPELNQYYLIEAWGKGADVPDTVLGDTGVVGMFDLNK